MTVHNYAEEEVLEKVAEVFDAEDAKPVKGFCTCEMCRADVACFVLNRFTPVYQTSGRGLAHRDLDYQEKLQRDADLVSLIYRGIGRITEAQRPHSGAGCSEPEAVPEGFFYNFPQIVGRLFHSTSFAPVTGTAVRLLSDSGEEMKMVDTRWANPCVISERTPGVFSFWPVPEKSDRKGEEKSFSLKIAVDAEAFEPLRRYFTLSVGSEAGYLRFDTGARIHSLPDMFLVPL